jgi:hypothetical protein
MSDPVGVWTGLGDELPYKSRTRATYHATAEGWLRLADALDKTGTRRIAVAIRRGVPRARARWQFGLVPLRFVDGSIAVIDEAIREIEEATSDA